MCMCVCVCVRAHVFAGPTTNLGKRECDVLFRGRIRVKFNKRKIQPGGRVHLRSFQLSLRRKYLRTILRFLSGASVLLHKMYFYFMYLQIGNHAGRDVICCHNGMILTSAEDDLEKE